MLRRALLLLFAILFTAPAPQRLSAQGTIVIVSGQFPAQPVPTLTRGTGDNDVADLLFLRLARLGPTLVTAGDQGFEPQLAKKWTRRDSLTLVFELDPRAMWHDGVPVTSRDVIWTFGRAHDPAAAPAMATALRWIRDVTAEGDHRVVVRFVRRYPTQLYDAAWQMPVLPAHLLDTIPAAQLSSSAFAKAPIGDGPYRFVRSTPGQFVELAAVQGHFLGTPKLTRVLYRAAADNDARINLLLSGEGDGLEQVALRPQQDRFVGQAEFRLIPVPSFQIGFALFNQRDPDDSSAKHPVFGDSLTRQALVLALDRTTIARVLYGDAANVPEGPASMSLWARTNGPALPQGDTTRAVAMLHAAGWRDADGDGVLDRNGRPLRFAIMIPATSLARRLAAQVIQEQWRRIGAQADITPLDFAAYVGHRNSRRFDVDIAILNQDPDPAGLSQGWSCGGGSNIGSYCDPAVDSMITRAASAPDGGRALWQGVLRRIDADAPAAFLFAPANVIALHRRFADVALRPESLWSGLAKWRVTPGQQLPRDAPVAP